MSKVEFYFDPACPWCWVTSRWLLLVSNKREIDITWRPFSLAMKNGKLDKTEDDNPYTKKQLASHRVLRIMVAAAEQHGVSLADSYTAFGIKHHTAGFNYDDEWITTTLEELNLPAELIKAGEDHSLDTHLQSELDSAIEVVGEDVGVPTIVFTNDDDTKQGYFGPVIMELPEMDEALKLWDGLSSLATVKSFYELKRSRPSGGPDTASTARC